MKNCLFSKAGPMEVWFRHDSLYILNQRVTSGKFYTGTQTELKCFNGGFIYCSQKHSSSSDVWNCKWFYFI
jgi:hypothetical protein